MSAAPDRAEELFNEHSRRIYAYCLRRLGSREEAEDAVQATYLNACRSLLSGFEPDVAQAWLFKVAQNVCLTRQRSAWRRRRIERPEDIQEIEEFIPSPHEPGDELLGIDVALASLPEQQQRAILLREWQGLSYREVAAEMGITQGAVETLIFRARRSLAAALEAPERPQTRRARLAHALDGGALIASLKTAFTGSLSTSVATGLAVVASTTAIATGPVHTTDLFRHGAPASTEVTHETRASSRLFERVAPADRDASSVTRQAGGQENAKAKGRSRNHSSPNGKANGHAKENAKNASTRAEAGKPASPGKAAPPPQSHAGGNGNSHVGGNGKSQGKN
jgi:RNA polymerase sigma-70 factor, ECF subfamily